MDQYTGCPDGGGSDESDSDLHMVGLRLVNSSDGWRAGDIEEIPGSEQWFERGRIAGAVAGGS